MRKCIISTFELLMVSNGIFFAHARPSPAVVLQITPSGLSGWKKSSRLFVKTKGMVLDVHGS